MSLLCITVGIWLYINVCLGPIFVCLMQLSQAKTDEALRSLQQDVNDCLVQTGSLQVLTV